jgi:hypothetical protein
MHERWPKSNAIDTLLYERDLLRHCAKTINAKKRKFVQSKSDEDAAEYYLGIEGFLLHFRNLLGFFTNRGRKQTDLTINRPERWAGKATVDQAICRDLTARARKVNQKHGLQGGDCYQKISWFLQHCTVHRHLQPRSWDIAAMFADIEPVLDDFVRNFSPKTETAVRDALIADSNSTATITRSVMPLLLAASRLRKE